MLLLLTELAFGYTNDWQPRYLSGLPLLYSYDSTVNIDSYSVPYDYQYEDYYLNFPYKKDYFDNLVRQSYRYSVYQAKSLGAIISDCKVDLNVHLVQLDGQTLNKDDRFKSWRTVNGGNLAIIYGLYDPTPYLSENSVIVFSSVPRITNDIVLHELAHYWYDRFCLYESINLKTEEFAKAVERDYDTNIR